MPNTVKKSTVLWALGGLLAPFILQAVMESIGIYLSGLLFWIIPLSVCGYFAYRSYKGTPALKIVSKTTPNVAVHSTSMSGQAKFGLAAIGAALGFGIGYLTRPTFLGEKLPLGLLFEKAPAEFAQLKSEYVMHMTVATVIGLAAAMALAFVVGAARKA